ncbi:autotransporter outer membrane beta-barrel domain-containing protein [Paraburkholderia humisilvae]|uniref:autotransporter outer membrane beta-barrel domain-containing protein n=1 Tax=Paraburkholderia humisilvae TaxID=627669 RepID=UPI0015844145|nr:autotransporter outer membrane beta-barrel domain-containing protein [Paraburkholderia humisilvae]
MEAAHGVWCARVLQFVCRAFYKRRLLSLVMLTLMVTSQSTFAQTSIPAGANLNGFTPANGDIWNLQGDAYLSNGTSASFAKALPLGTPGLTINGVASGSTVTLNDGAGHYAYFSGGATILNLSDIRFTGGLVPAGVNGGVINTTGALVINTTGTVSFINNSAGRNGGVIYATQPVTINGSVVANNNSALNGSGGGVIYVASGAITINGSVSMDSNFAGGPSNTSPAGALYANGGISLATTGGDVSLTNNLSNTSGGAASSGTSTIAVGNSAASITLTGNRAGFNKDGTQHSVGFGGALRAFGAINVTGRSITMSSNTATGNGGALYANNTVTVSGDLLANDNVALVGAGGAIYALAGDVTTTGNISMTGNQAGSGGGGAILANNGNVNLSTSNGNVSLINNTASSHGGAINGSANFAIGNSGGTVTITGNNAGFNPDGTSANTTSHGGAISSNGPTIVTGGPIVMSNNTATQDGGGVYSAQAVSISGALTAQGNTSRSGSGGFVYALGDIDLVATGASTVSGNTAGTAAAQGGAMRGGSSLSLSASGGDLAFMGNSAGGLGGAIYIDPASLVLSATGGDISFSGNTQNTAGTPQANAIYIANGGSGTAVTLNAATGHSITFYDPLQNNGANGLITVTKSGPGMVSFDGSRYGVLTNQWSQVYANTDVQAGTFEVANGAVYGVHATTVGGTSDSTFATAAGTTLQGGVAGTVIADQFTLGGSLSVAGRQPGARGVFTVDSNHATFSPGSQVLFNTYLNDGVIQNTDLLVLDLNGSAVNGQALVRVANAGGPGGLTVGDGIKLVQANNGTTAGAFALAPGEARGGAFDYRLYRGGVAGSDSEDWFLRSDMVIGPEPGEPSVPGEPILPEEPAIPNPQDLPLNPPPSVLPPGEYPIIGPEIATYSVVQPLARQLGLTMLGTMHERIGDTLTDAGGGMDGAGIAHSGWVRMFGEQVDNRYQTYTDARANGQILGMQAGLDVWRGSLLPTHHDAAGVYFAYGNSNVDVDGLVTNADATAYVLSHTGKVNLNAYSGGAYWTHYGPGGWYIDAILQGTSYGGDATTQNARLPISGTGFATSLETGYPFQLPLGPGFVLEPQAQIIWQHVGLSEANDGLGSVDPGSTSGVTGRLGVRGQWTIDGAHGQVWQPYVRANLWRDWGAQATTLYSGADQVPLAQQFTRMDFAAGVTAKLDTRMSLYGQFGYQFSINSSATGSQKGVWGDIGFRYTW